MNHAAESRQTPDRPLGDLVSELSQQLSELARDELRLAKLEMTRKGKQASTGIGMLGGARPDRSLWRRLPHCMRHHRHQRRASGVGGGAHRRGNIARRRWGSCTAREGPIATGSTACTGERDRQPEG
jgi:hypothetical protein